MSASSTLPGWLAEPVPVVIPERRPHRFLRKTLARLEHLTLALGPGGSARGRWDPRVKLASALVVLVALALLHNPVLISAAGIALILLAARHRVAGSLAVVATPALLMTLVLVAPATLSAVRPGTVVVPLWPDGGMTAEGLRNAWIVLARVLACLTVAVLLTRTTSWLRLLAALRAVGAPAGFVLVATMAHRYLSVLADAFADLLLARRARSVGGATAAEDRHFVGAAVGALLGRSGDLAEEVHQAMVARGFSGRLRDPAPRPLAAVDLLLGLGCVAASALLLWGDVVVR